MRIRTIDVNEDLQTYEDVKDYKSNALCTLNPNAMKALESERIQDLAFDCMKNVRLSFTDSDNKLSCGNSILNNVGIRINGSNNVILIEDECDLSGVLIHIVGTGCLVYIGQNTKFSGNHWGINCISCKGKHKTIQIGEQSLLSGNIIIRNNDGHDILDEAGNKINNETNIHIGKHTWICEGSRILKGAGTKDNTIVGCCSIVTKTFYEPNIIIAGNPAKKIKELQNLWRK